MTGLGIRYRPGSRDDVEAHEAKVAALMTDLIDADPGKLENAARLWVKESPFFPKCSDLLATIRRLQPVRGEPDLNAACNRYNERLAAEGKTHLVWVNDGRNMWIDAA